MHRNGHRIFSLGFFIFFLLSGGVFAEEPPAVGTGLTLKEAVEIALAHHPTLLAARGALQAQRARVGEARSNYFPQLDLQSDYTRATSNFAPNPQFRGLNQATASESNTSFDNYSASLSLQQRIFDFGKTSAEVELARENLQGSSWNEEASRQTIVVNVKVAYFGLLEARHLVQVNEETVRQFQEHLEQTQGFYKAGTRTRFDVTKAEVDLTNARLELIKARNAEDVARITLANAMGVPDQPIGKLEELLSFKKIEILEDQAIREALESRPELLSLSAQRRAAEASVRSAKRNYFPVLFGVADYTYRGQDFPLVWNWDLSLNLTVPIFSGYRTQSQVAEARANLLVVGANEEALRQNVILEVHQAFSNLKDAEERVQTSEIVVRQAEENFDLANGRFQAGVGTSVERTDAQVLLTNAKTSQIQALYDYRVAEAQLLKAMGRGE
jgi:TolC family type I secretion outer membrane protein